MTNLVAGLLIASYPAVMLIGYILGAVLERHWWRGEMVERGHARYHFYDGKWYWNEDVPKPSDPIARRVAEANRNAKPS